MDIGLLISLVMVLFTFSFFFWKDNFAFRFAEHSVIAVMIGNTVAIGIKYIIDDVATPISKGNVTLLAGLLISFLIFASLGPKKNTWVTRYPYAFAIGTGLAVTMRGAIDLDVKRTLIYMISSPLGQGKYTPFDNIYLIAMGLMILYYFIYSAGNVIPRTVNNPILRIARIGFLTYLGVLFGTTTLTRFSWLGERIEFILTTVLGLFGIKI